MKGLEDQKWTIHGHPLKDGKIYTGRQYFSSTDICREFVKSRDGNEYIAQFLVYPHQQIQKGSEGQPTGKKVIHNRVRTLVFPDTQTIVAAMRDSNPGVDPYAITPESGQNKNTSDGRLVNDSGVDWFRFQEALAKYGCMGIMDIEGPAGGMQVDAADPMFKQSQGVSTNWAMIGLIVIGFAALMKARGSSVFGVEDGCGADFESRHWWN